MDQLSKSMQNLNITLPSLEKTKHSTIQAGAVASYAANTHQGIFRNYNEDRVSIILNIVKNKQPYNPKISFFGIFDGHGGALCADFLRDNLHQFVIRESCFLNNPKEALHKGFAAAEKQFLTTVYKQMQAQPSFIERSGSCAIVLLIVDNLCYIANVGDSRAVLSQFKGQKVTNLSRDHKPSCPHEIERITKAGGQIYQAKTEQNGQIIVGPHRVFPGRLSVSRTFGDIEAKLSQLGGNPDVVISEPDIKVVQLDDTTDFILLGSDGIFDKVESENAINIIWENMIKAKQEQRVTNIHEGGCVGVEALLKETFVLKSLDNVTALMIGFKGLQDYFLGLDLRSSCQRQENLNLRSSVQGIVQRPKKKQIFQNTLYKSIDQLKDTSNNFNSSKLLKPTGQIITKKGRYDENKENEYKQNQKLQN